MVFWLSRSRLFEEMWYNCRSYRCLYTARLKKQGNIDGPITLVKIFWKSNTICNQSTTYMACMEQLFDHKNEHANDYVYFLNEWNWQPFSPNFQIRKNLVKRYRFLVLNNFLSSTERKSSIFRTRWSGQYFYFFTKLCLV